MTTPSLDGFVAAVREYCALAEEDIAGLTPPDVCRVRGLLLRLLFNAPAVRAAPQSAEFDGTRPDEARYLKVVRRFSGLRYNSYRVVFDPHDFEADNEPCVAMLTDDLADIWRDLAEGLSNMDRGHPCDACFDWSLSYRSHWARHAVNALAAIETYRTDYDDVEPDAAHEPPPAAGVRESSENMNIESESEAPADGGGR